MKMKLPASVGQKKIKAIEQLLQELGIGRYTQSVVNRALKMNERMFLCTALTRYSGLRKS